MGRHWLLDLPEILRYGGCKVETISGWETRSRSTGGLEEILGVACHHTAGAAGAQNEPGGERYSYFNAADRPIGNMHLRRNGTFMIGAAGAANTQGRGGPITTSKGTCPLDKGNIYFIAIEAHNNGIGEIWPAAQIEAYVRGLAALCEGYGLNPLTDIVTHAGYCQPSCPGRKIDPAGPTPSLPNLGGSVGAATWSQANLRQDVYDFLHPAPPPKPVSNTYTVKSGDSWWRISQMYKITVDQLTKMQNPPATATTVIHPGDVLIVPGTAAPAPAPPPPPAQNWQQIGADALTPPGDPMLELGVVHSNVTWYQAVLTSMPKLPADGGGPILDPMYVDNDRTAGLGPRIQLFGDASKAATVYWQSKNRDVNGNPLVADGKLGPVTSAAMRAVRGK